MISEHPLQLYDIEFCVARGFISNIMVLWFTAGLIPFIQKLSRIWYPPIR